jgi:hypothetical protein
MKDSHSFDPGSNPGTSTPTLRTIVRNELLSLPVQDWQVCLISFHVPHWWGVKYNITIGLNVAQRKFPRLTESEMIEASGDYIIYIFGVAMIASIGFVFSFSSDDDVAILCFLCNSFFIGICVIALQFKLIADSVAAGMVMFEQHKSNQENQQTEQDMPEQSDEELPQPVLATSNLTHSGQKESKKGPTGQKTKPTGGKKPPRGPPIDSAKIRAEISEITEELKMLKPMYNHAINVKDTETKDKIRPRIETLLKKLTDLRSSLPAREEE